MLNEGRENVMSLSRSARIAGGVYGAVVGDALGVPYEFTEARHLPPQDLLEMTPPGSFNRAHVGVPEGTWSDDGAQMLVLMNALFLNASLDLRQLTNGFLNWRNLGFMTPDGRVFDIGLQTSRALARLDEGVSPEISGGSTENDNGNGSLMRCLPCVLFTNDPQEVVRLARLQSLPTHGHLRSQLTCALYALVCHGLILGQPIDPALTEARIRIITSITDSEQDELKLILASEQEAHSGSGYVVDCFWSAIHCLRTTKDFESCIKAAIALGNDTDTTACTAGGLAGLLYGVQSIPPRWMNQLKGKGIVEEQLSKLRYITDGQTQSAAI